MMLISSSQTPSRLPPEYQEVQWLRGSGTQYCQTSYTPVFNSNHFTSIKGDLTVLDSATLLLCANKTSYPSERYGVYIHNRYFEIGVQPNYAQAILMSTLGNTPLNIHYELTRNAVSINGTDYPKSGMEHSITSYILIGAEYAQNGVSIKNENVNIKAFSLYDNDTLICDIIPCYRKSDIKAGFYQTIVPSGFDNFIYNLGSGSDWLTGPNI